MTNYYKCTFLSDVVLQASANTEGNVALADFIAGSNFLGMVAASNGYSFFKEDAFDVFHSGKVSFGDGHIVVNKEMSYKIPLSYFGLKIGEGTYNRMHLSDDEEQALRDEQKQLKQIRSGFMNLDGEYLVPSYNYAQKSQHSKKHRRSKDEGMFGYSALKKGTEWIFKITFEDEKYIKNVEELLLGEKRLGKSKSAEYGRVVIASIESPKDVATFSPSKETYLYFNSRVALVDEVGNPTFIPTIKNLGLENGEIEFSRSQLKSSAYNPYNYVRQTKDYTRTVLNKGCVVVIKGELSDDEIEKIKKGVGIYRSEGFGDVLVNPEFLKPEEPFLKKVESVESIKQTEENVDKNLLAFLRLKEESEENRFSVALEVQDVYKELLGASKSQWSEVRSIASSVEENELVEKIKEYIETGTAKKQWENIGLIKAIEKSNQKIPFTILLAKICRQHTKGAN